MAVARANGRQATTFEAVYAALSASPGTETTVVADVEVTNDSPRSPATRPCCVLARHGSPREAATTASSGPSRTLRESGDGDLFLGLDVGGRPEKGFDLCAALWRNGVLVDLQFSRLPHAVALPKTIVLRKMVAEGDIAGFADATAQAAACASRRIVDALARLGRSPEGVFIDSPSAFSRNRLVGALRASGRAAALRSILSRPGTVRSEELNVALGWLDGGVVKGHEALYDRVDALVALLSGVSFAGLGFDERELDGVGSINWVESCSSGAEVEGRIALPV